MRETAIHIRRLETRITPDATLAEAEEWWPLALRIGWSLDRDDATSAEARHASHALVWAVSDAIRAMKRSARADHRGLRAALAGLQRSLKQRGAAAREQD